MGAPIAAARTPGGSVIPLLLVVEEFEEGVRDVICGVSAVFVCEVLMLLSDSDVAAAASSEVNVLSHFVTKVVV